ncbi:hypothetical protein ACGC1H_003461 [Rhizoctonia solani]|uniref:Uncharacterized protein n=1 Tax=Rhizoctonia solani TaxID=456999 RepID=A0A8H3H6I3_9AGAM|nr:unnamed protein product [Rhizoctonia solani]
MRTAFVVSALAFIVPALSAPTVIPISKRAGPIIPGSYIVKFKDGSLTETIWSNLVETLHSSGSSITYDYRSLMPACALKLNEAALSAIQRMPQVEYIEQDSIMSLSEHDDEPAPLDLASFATVGRDALVRRTDDKCGKRGEGVIVYGIDTGVYIEHYCFGGRASHGANFAGDDNDNDGNGHGTHTAATAVCEKFGVATKAKLVAVKVLGANGSGSTSGVMAGVKWASDHYKGQEMPAVATMSLGGLFSQAMNDAVKSAIDIGLHFTIAAGNDNLPAKLYSPASVEQANTIGAVDSENKKASFSNFGPTVDVWALGVNVESAWITGPDSSKALSGTSMSTPHVAGILASALSNHGRKSPKQLSDALEQNAMPITDPLLLPHNKLAVCW